MKLELFSNEATKLWKKASSPATDNGLQIELELYKKLLSFFQVGDYFYYVFNFSESRFDLVSPQSENLLGYKPTELTPQLYMDLIHPDDRSWFLAFESNATDFFTQMPADKLMKYKMRYDFRLRRKDGTYIRILHQSTIIEHDNLGGVIRTIGVDTDITDLKSEGLPVLSYIGTDGEPSYHNVDIKNTLIESRETLSPREKQVLILLIEGKLSKEISEILNISKQTVDTHRKNMLRRNSLNNTGELIGKAIKQGWL